MPIRSAAVGKQTAPQVVDITPRRLLAYAAGLGASQPHYLDDAAATGIVGHPAFCVTLEWPVTLVLREAEILGMSWEEKIRGVHAAQDSIFHRPIRSGDRLRTVASLVQVRRIRPGAFVLTKFETVDDRTEAPVVTSYASSIYRDVDVEGEAVTARLEGVAGGKRGGAPTGSGSGDCNLCQSKKWSRVVWRDECVDIV